jgi:hypothetical protein
MHLRHEIGVVGRLRTWREARVAPDPRRLSDLKAANFRKGEAIPPFTKRT